MATCKYCLKDIEDDASKCNHCGEFQTFYGRFLRSIPTFSLLITLASFGFGLWQLQEKQVVTAEKDKALVEKDSAIVVQKKFELKFEKEKKQKEELAQDLISKIRNESLSSASLPIMNDQKFNNLKNRAESNPNNKTLQNEYLLNKSIRYLKGGEEQ